MTIDTTRHTGGRRSVAQVSGDRQLSFMVATEPSATTSDRTSHRDSPGAFDHSLAEHLVAEGEGASSARASMPGMVVAAEAQSLARDAVTLATQAYAENTRRAYTKDFERFCQWCVRRGYEPLPATTATLAMYLTSRVRDGKKVATLKRDLTAISQAHVWAGHPRCYDNPEIKTLMAGIKRELGFEQTRKAPLFPNDLRLMLARIDEPGGLLGLRDRALLLLCFAGGLRRSEVVALDVDDIAEVEGEGLCLSIGRGKTDQSGRRRDVGIPFGDNALTCPVRNLRSWLEASGIREGAVFVGVVNGQLRPARLLGQDVARRVKHYANKADMDARKLAGHSLRAGLVMAAATAGKTERDIMRQTGHESVLMLRGYVRRANLFVDNAAAGIGL